MTRPSGSRLRARCSPTRSPDGCGAEFVSTRRDPHPMAGTMRIAFRLGSSFLFAVVAVGCGGGSNSPGGAKPATAVVGKSGGAVTSMDGNVGVTIPAGALGTDVRITVAPAEAPASGAVGTVYEIGPTGTQFAMPVALKL